MNLESIGLPWRAKVTRHPACERRTRESAIFVQLGLTEDFDVWQGYWVVGSQQYPSLVKQEDYDPTIIQYMHCYPTELYKFDIGKMHIVTKEKMNEVS